MKKEGKLKQAIRDLSQPTLVWEWEADDLTAPFIIPDEFAGTLRIESESGIKVTYTISVETKLGITQVIESGIPDLLKAILRAEELLFADYPNAEAEPAPSFPLEL